MGYTTEQYRTYREKRYAERMQLGRDTLGGVCVQCGTSENLEFDHIDRSTKSFEVTTGWTRKLSLFMEELTKCQLLCAEHHLDKTRKERGVSHGGGVWGKNKCPCDPCRLKRNEYLRNWKRNKRAGVAEQSGAILQR